MNTSEIYSQIIIENIVKKYLERGAIPTIEQIEEEFAAAAASQDLSSSNFTFDEWSVERKEVSSATKYNRMNGEIQQDLNVLYKSLYANSERSTQLFTRWQGKATALESRLKNLEARIGRLLVLSADTSGYFDTVGDRFTDTKLIDLDRSSGMSINLPQNVVTLDKSNTKVDRKFFNDLRPDQAVFNVITRTNVVSVTNIQNTEPRFAFRDQNQFWKTHVAANQRISPVTTELLLSLDASTTASRIDLVLHSSQSNAVTIVTPLTSLDGINYSRVPSINTVNEGIDKVTFNFPQTEFKFLKLILEKTNFDFVEGGLFVFEFGAREIAIYDEGFSTEDGTFGTLVSKPLSITKPDKSLVRFNKLTLEVCEGISSETKLDYFISVAQDVNGTAQWLVTTGFSPDIEDVNGDDQRLWYPITPTNRTESIHPKILDFATLSKIERANIGISYDKTGGSGDFISPAEAYTLLESAGAGIGYSNQTATAQRYIFANSIQKALDLQIDTDAPVDIDTLTLWRNVGEKGITPGDTTKLVRGVQAGWEYKAPYYYTSILIKNSNGIVINVGNNPINIDNVNYTGVISPDVLNAGTHEIRVHQDFWNEVEPNLTSLEALKAADILYPFNQKLLIEGYAYSFTDDNEERIYQGVDRFAGFLCKKISLFDIANNIKSSDFGKYAIDTDVSGATPNGESYILIVNCDNSKADFVNEKFVLEFNLTNQLYSYLALKTEFRTTNSKLTPVLDEYKIKLGF